jgi:hypothetical protein
MTGGAGATRYARGVRSVALVLTCVLVLGTAYLVLSSVSANGVDCGSVMANASGSTPISSLLCADALADRRHLALYTGIAAVAMLALTVLLGFRANRA